MLKRILASVGIAGIVLSGLAQSPWEQLKRPNVSDPLVVKMIGNVLYAGLQQAGLYSSNDFGKTWDKVPGLPEASVTSIVKSATILYVSFVDHSAYYSLDNGVKWIPINSVSTPQSWLDMEAKGDTLYVVNKTGFFTSYDRGKVFVPNTVISLSNLTNAAIVGIAAHKDSLYVLSTAGAALSTNHGLTWKKVAASSKRVGDVQHYQGLVYMAATEGVFVSSDGGKSWLLKSKGLSGTEFYQLGFSGSKVYVASNEGLFVSNNQGGSWWNLTSTTTQKMAAGPLNVHSFAIDQSTVYAAIRQSGVYKSENNGGEWLSLNQELSGEDIHAIATFKDTVIVGDALGDLYFSIDKGKQFAYFGHSDTVIQTLQYNPSNRYLYTTAAGGVRIYDPSRRAVVASQGGGALREPVIKVAFYEDTVYLLTPSFLYKGLTPTGPFVKLYDHTRTGEQMTTLYIVKGVLLVGSNTTVVFTSELHNQSLLNEKAQGFEKVVLPKGAGTKSFAFDGNKVYVGTQYGLYESTNFGRQWQKSTLEATSINDVIVRDKEVFVSTSAQGNFYSSNKGKSWVANNTLFTSEQLRVLAVSEEYLFGGSNATGLWRTRLMGSIITDWQEETQATPQYVVSPVTDALVLPEETMGALEIIASDGHTVLSTSPSGGMVNVSTLPAGCYVAYRNGRAYKFLKQ